MKRLQMRRIGMMIALCVVCLTTPKKGIAATILTESKVEVSEYKEGKVISSVNVREGAGIHNPKVTVNKKNVVLTKGMLVSVLGETKVSGKVWYHVKLTFDGQEVTGYSSGAYIKLTGNVITPEPTETPTPTVVVTPKATPTINPTVTVVAPSKETTSEPKTEESSTFKGIYILVLIIAVSLVVAGAIYYVIRLMYRSREREIQAIQNKVENLKNINLDTKSKSTLDSTPERPKIGKRSDIFDNRFAKEASEVYLKSDEETSEISREEVLKTLLPNRKDVAQLQSMIEGLKEHDIIYHKYFGRGEVFDNSDVKLIEIRFKTGDSRFFNKKELASKNLIRKIEKEAV